MAPRGYNRGANQHGGKSLISQYPDLPAIIQGLLNDNVRQKDIPDMLRRDHHINASLRSVQAMIKKYEIKTSRRPRMDPLEQGIAILTLEEKDKLGRWGCRLVKEKDFIMEFRREADPEATAARHPVTRKKHQYTLWCIGPNEEWGLDGREKILQDMGIAIWGIIDKFSRLELLLRAVPNARDSDVPRMLYLQLVLEKRGMPLFTTADMGSELSKLIPVVTTLRKKSQRFLDEEVMPAHQSVKSIYNITRERSWRALWEKELANVKHEYLSGKFDSGFREGIYVDQIISRWLWGAIVQKTLDDYRIAHGKHYVRRQEKTLLPSGGRRIEFYNNPGRWDGEDCMIRVKEKDAMDLLNQSYKPQLLQFGSDDEVSLCQGLYKAIGSPSLEYNKGLVIFKKMIKKYNELVEDLE